MDSVSPQGIVVSVRGAVVDVSFGGGTLPSVNTALIVEWDRSEQLILEVHSHVDPVTVRSIALQATAGLARNTRVRSTGSPISVPVGDAVLGRLLDVVGTVRDRGPALPSDTPRRASTIHHRGSINRIQPAQCSRRHQGNRPALAACPRRQGRNVRWGRCR